MHASSMGLPLRQAAGYRTWSKSDAALGDYVTVLKATDEATDALQTARAGQKLREPGRVLPRRLDAAAVTQSLR